jgi:hypothetical protein
MRRAVARGRKSRRLAARSGVDAKAIAKRHRYVTISKNVDRHVRYSLGLGGIAGAGTNTGLASEYVLG